ncbi:MAG: ATP-binding protein [bacterium]|nr:ATP-binding protein [bacterium]
MRIDKMKSSGSFKVRIRVLVPMVISIVFLLGAFVFTVYRIQDRNASNIVMRKLNSVRQLFNAQLESDAGMMSAVLKPFFSDKRMISALSAKDRNSLLGYSKPLFEQLRAEHKITHLYFIGPDRINILRVHNPGKYGDIISRFTTLEAERTKKLSYGIELGLLGTFTLRVVVPCYEKGRLLGYVELGEEIDHLVNKLSRILRVDVYIAIKKKFISRKEWESGMAILKRNSNWDKFPSAVIVSENQESFPRELAYYLPEEHHVRGITEVSFKKNGRYYRARFQYLKDVSGREVGEMIIVYDITEIISSGKSYVFALIFIYLAVGGLLFFFFYVYLARVERTLTAAQKELTEWNRTLEEKVKEKIKELEKVQAKVVQSNKMAAVGQLAGGIAHEINNPIAVILGFAQSIVYGVKENDSLYMPLKSIEREAIRCKKLVGDLLTFSRTGKTQAELADINTTINDTLSLIEVQAKVKGVEIVKNYRNELPNIAINKNQIQQVIVNLCNNAIDACQGRPEGRKITVITDVTTEQSSAEDNPDKSGPLQNRFIIISISDTGQGMTKEVKQHIFEPFFTTKEAGEGTGLGLSLCYETIQKHNGTIEVKSELGQGTTFKIKLPVD